MRVTATGLAHSFPGTGTLFAGLGFELAAGDLVAVTGPSGSGKSTLLSLLARWEKPREGEITWDGVASVGWVFQNPHGTARRATLDHVALPLVAKGCSRREADEQAAAVLSRFDMAHLADRPFGALSGGEGQRLMLARAVAKAPSLLLVDEPTAQLDPASSETVNRVIAELAMDQAIVVVATHDPDTRDACPRRIDLRRHAEGSSS